MNSEYIPIKEHWSLITCVTFALKLYLNNEKNVINMNYIIIIGSTNNFIY